MRRKRGGRRPAGRRGLKAQEHLPAVQEPGDSKKDQDRDKAEDDIPRRSEGLFEFTPDKPLGELSVVKNLAAEIDGERIGTHPDKRRHGGLESPYIHHLVEETQKRGERFTGVEIANIIKSAVKPGDLRISLYKYAAAVQAFYQEELAKVPR